MFYGVQSEHIRDGTIKAFTMMQRHSFTPAKQIKKVWKSAQLLIGFHKGRDGQKYDNVRTWAPDNARAGLNADTSKQEAFVVLEAATGAEDDVQIKLRQDQIVVRRDNNYSWQGVIIEDGYVAVQTADGAWIKIEADGAVVRQTEWDETAILADSSVEKRNQYVIAMMSGDGTEMGRVSPVDTVVVDVNGVSRRMKTE